MCKWNFCVQPWLMVGHSERHLWAFIKVHHHAHETLATRNSHWRKWRNYESDHPCWGLALWAWVIKYPKSRTRTVWKEEEKKTTFLAHRLPSCSSWDRPRYCYGPHAADRRKRERHHEAGYNRREPRAGRCIRFLLWTGHFSHCSRIWRRDHPNVCLHKKKKKLDQPVYSIKASNFEVQRCSTVKIVLPFTVPSRKVPFTVFYRTVP